MLELLLLKKKILDELDEIDRMEVVTFHPITMMKEATVSLPMDLLQLINSYLASIGI